MDQAAAKLCEEHPQREVKAVPGVEGEEIKRQAAVTQVSQGGKNGRAQGNPGQAAGQLGHHPKVGVGPGAGQKYHRQQQHGAERDEVGSVATLSRNFQLQLLRPVIGRAGLDLIVRSGSLAELLAQLQAHTLDLVLSNFPVRRDAETGWHSHLLNAQSVSLVGRWMPGQAPFRFPEDLRTTPLLLPTLASDIRAAFDLLLDQAGIRPIIAAEVDDMAMLRLLARESEGVTLVPRVVVQDELQAGVLVERHRISQIKESFYAITPSRRFPNPIVRELVLQMKAALESVSAMGAS